MITQTHKNVKLKYGGERGARSPFGKPNETFIGRSPTLWDSLSNHDMIISTLKNHFNGQMDDVKVFNYALTATQVKTLYSGGALNFAPVTGAP